MDKKNVQKSKKPKQSLKKRLSETIIEFFGKVTEKIIFILLRYIFFEKLFRIIFVAYFRKNGNKFREKK
jgi:hypothetical protein